MIRRAGGSERDALQPMCAQAHIGKWEWITRTAGESGGGDVREKITEASSKRVPTHAIDEEHSCTKEHSFGGLVYRDPGVVRFMHSTASPDRLLHASKRSKNLTDEVK